MAKQRISNSEILAQIPAAIGRAKRARRSEPHASTARYDAEDRVLYIGLTNGSAFSIPVARIPGLNTASDRDLSAVEIGPAGVGLRWRTLDADFSVAGLARLMLGSRTLLSAAGSAGGSARSEAKAQAARRNGLKGGRPKNASAQLSRRDRSGVSAAPSISSSTQVGTDARPKAPIVSERRPAAFAGRKNKK